MFFLRCAFWLSVVYASMSWTDHRFAMPGSQERAVVTSQGVSGTPARHVASQAASRVASQIAARAATLCENRLTACADDAMKLASLIAATDAPRDPREGDVKKRSRDGTRHP